MKLIYKRHLSDRQEIEIGNFNTPEEIVKNIKNYIVTNNLYPNRNYEDLIHICLPYHYIFIKMDLEEVPFFYTNKERDTSKFHNAEEVQLFDEQYFIIETSDKNFFTQVKNLLKTTE